ncbi:MAG: FAD binding domain-containing protein [Bacteroidota bacterium]
MDFDVISPKNSQELLEAISNLQDKKFRFGAGYTDLINDLNNMPQEGLTVINLAQLKDEKFNIISFKEKGVRIGALVTASQLMNNDTLKIDYPVLWEAANSVASMQIRETATVGGNICQASPAGDISCALVALKAICEIIDSSGNVREEKLSDFFQGVKITSLKKNEILRSIFFPSNSCKKIKSAYIKIGTRLSMEISIISIAYHFQMNAGNIITDAGLSIGAVAPTIKFAEDACNFLIGKQIGLINNEDVNNFACLVKNLATPISDVRASAWYRSEVLYNSAIAIFDK